ncbi:MAG TPA: efflux RND transporter permease subunit [Gemmataceae bacterium]|nr:efflux RND transporter permease subunit [Gemmataceae bacterium]
MNPIVFALRHPITVMVFMVAIIAGGLLVLPIAPDTVPRPTMKVDIFPSLNLPVIYVAQPYGGMDPDQMEGLLTYYYEYHFLYIGGIQRVESKNIQGNALMKLYFHPGTDMAQAMAETVQYVSRARAFMPPGTVPPFVMRFDTGSVPVGYLTLSSDSKTIGEIQDQALNKVRPMFAAIPGVSAPPPFGGSIRSIVVRADPDRLRAYHLSPEDVVKALTAGNTITPSGNVRIQEQMPIVPVNAMVVKPVELGKISIPVAEGKQIFLEDVVARDPYTHLPLIEDATDIPTGYAIVNGRRAVYILVTKRAEASTLEVVKKVRENLPKMQAVLPNDIKVGFEFDQSPFVVNSMKNVGIEAGLGAALTGLMVLIFLRDWRSVIVVVLNIPLALIGSIIALYLAGQTINLMTMGGLALAVGILVDEATVEVENIHTQFEHTDSIAVAVRRGNAQTAVPRLLAMLCILAVFVPSFLMQGAARALFVPLALAVGFAMITSYILSSTLVPVLSVWLLRGHRQFEAAKETRRTRFVTRGLNTSIALRWLVIPVYLVVAGLATWFVGSRLGRDIFPNVETNQFQLRIRAPTGTRIEQSDQIALEALKVIEDEAGKDNVLTNIGYVGIVPPSFPINAVYHWSGGSEEIVLRVALKPGRKESTEELKTRLRTKLDAHLKEWLAQKWLNEGIPEGRATQRAQELRLSFEPADIINTVMSFGSPTPVEVAVHGPNLADNRAHAEKVLAELQKIPSLKDLQVTQAFDYPAVRVNINRERARQLGVTAEDVGLALLSATSSSRFVVPNFWRDPGSGIGYQVQVEIPQARMNSKAEVEAIPVKRTSSGTVLVRDVADVIDSTMPEEYDRYQMRRVVSMTANIEGEDLGRVTTRLEDAIKKAGQPPQAVEVEIRGQVAPMNEMSRGLLLGLALAVVAIFLLLTGYFQSIRLAMIAVSALPAVILGAFLALWLTRTTLNIQSFMGTIMAVGVAVSNAILLVTFADQHWREGMSARDAAVAGARGRMRPILMTSSAMIAGMLPMALAIHEGSEQTAPLGRAVIGGLAASVVATLFVLPAVFTWIQGWYKPKSVSLDPGDQQSAYFVEGFAH